MVHVSHGWLWDNGPEQVTMQVSKSEDKQLNLTKKFFFLPNPDS